MHHHHAGAQERANAGYLRYASPDAALHWMQTNWTPPNSEWSVERVDRALAERILFSRNEPLIDYALARYGCSRSIIQRVVERRGGAHLIAAFMNPEGSVGLTEAHQALVSGRYHHLEALLSSQYLPSGFLSNLLRRKNHFSEIPDEQFRYILHALQKNPRLTTPYQEIMMDGYAEYSYGDVFSAVWELVETVPATQVWAGALWQLLSRTCKPVSFKNAEHAIQRWQIDEPKTANELKWFAQSNSFHVRTYLADLKPADDTLLRSKDRAQRASFYRRFKPQNFPKWEGWLKQDDSVFFNAALDNEGIWRDSRSREILARIAWKVSDPHSSMDAPNDFRFRERHHRKEHPSWFAESDDEGHKEGIDPGKLPVTAVDIERLQKVVYQIEKNVLPPVHFTKWLVVGCAVGLLAWRYL